MLSNAVASKRRAGLGANSIAASVTSPVSDSLAGCTTAKMVTYPTGVLVTQVMSPHVTVFG